MFFIIKGLSLHYFFGELVTTLVIPVINFLLNNYWTFNIESEGGTLSTEDTSSQSGI